MTCKSLFLFGAFSPILYVLMTILGAAMRPDYSHIYHAVSELLEAGAPNKLLLDIFLSSYSISSSLFGFGVLQLVQESHQKRKIGLLAASLLIAAGILSLLTAVFFPMDPRNTPLTFPGLMHLIIVGILSMLSIITPFLLAGWLKSQPDYTRYETYSFISGIIILVTGLFAAAAAFSESQMMGLWERLTIAAYLQWTFILALKMYASSKKTR